MAAMALGQIGARGCHARGAHRPPRPPARRGPGGALGGHNGAGAAGAWGRHARSAHRPPRPPARRGPGGRLAATMALGPMGPGAATPEVLTALLALLRDADQEVRPAAAGALGQMGPGAATPEVLTALLALLHDSEGRAPGSRRALGRIGPGAATPEVLTALLALLHDAEGCARQPQRRWGRWGWGPRRGAHRSPRPPARRGPGGRQAARALGQLGPGAATPEVLTALLALLRDADREVRQAAAGALRNLSAHVRAQQRSETTKLFLRLTRSRDAEQRDTGYECLRNLLAAESS